MVEDKKKVGMIKNYFIAQENFGKKQDFRLFTGTSTFAQITVSTV